MKIKNILVPVDFSACSKNALRCAIQIAKSFEAKIHMVNAVHVHHPHPDFIGGGLVDAIVSDYENQVKQSFDELETEIIELQDVPHEADRFISYLTDAIFSETQAKEIDLIVMGTRADHDKIEHFIGSRATDVIESAKVPVLVIPENFHDFTFKTIGLASDLHEIKNYRKLGLLKMLAKSFESTIMIFSVVEDPNKLSEVEQKHLREIVDFFKESECSARTIQSNSVVDGIIAFTKSHDLDMLAMIPREKSFFGKLFKGSVTKNIALDIDIPLLSFYE